MHTSRWGSAGGYKTLVELADALLPGTPKMNGNFPPAALYAVHKALMADDVGFRPFGQVGRQQSYLFEISPTKEVATTQAVEELVREFYEQPLVGPGRTRNLDSAIGRFILKARIAIDHSRRARQWSPHGMLGPSGGAQLPPLDQDWTATDTQILDFLHLWASYQKFANSSSRHWIGAAILRALERYEEAEFLTTSAGWAFLQEVGWITPWDIPSRYRLRLPGVLPNRSGGLLRNIQKSQEDTLAGDVSKGSRKDWAHVISYCIDSASATDIDDAISLERTGKEDEFLIHVHVADPASRIMPNTPLAIQAALVPQTAYLPGHFERMLPADFVRANFSLAPDRPCLTFSARVNLAGEVLDREITPGTLKKVIYMTPQEAAKVCGETGTTRPLATQAAFSVGTPPEELRPAQPEDDDGQRARRRGCRRPEDALTARRGTSLSPPRQRRHAALLAPGLGRRCPWRIRPSPPCPADCSIARATRTSACRTTTVRPCASSRARCVWPARWQRTGCAARDIPAPFRTEPKAMRNLAALRAFTSATLYPQLRAGIRPPATDWRRLAALVGSDDVAATPLTALSHGHLHVRQGHVPAAPLLRPSFALANPRSPALIRQRRFWPFAVSLSPFFPRSPRGRCPSLPPPPGAGHARP